MKRIRFRRSRGESRPVSYLGPHGPLVYVARDDRTRTVITAPFIGETELEYGPGTPPFGDILGRIGDTKVLISYAKWGKYEPGRHAFEIEFGDQDYVLVSRGGRRPTPQLETADDGTLLAIFRRRGGAILESVSREEAILVALIGGSGLTDLTLPQHWSPRR